jgi:hypothetical protein
MSGSAGGDESQLLQPVLGTDVSQKFKPLETVAVITLELILSVSLHCLHQGVGFRLISKVASCSHAFTY